MDRRLTPFNGSVAHVSLRGRVEAERFVEGEPRRVAKPVSDLLSAPDGSRDRQLLRGDLFRVLDLRDGFAFGFAEKDGYAGWMVADALVDAAAETPTHRVASARTYGKSSPGLKAMGHVTPLSMGARLTVLDAEAGWARIAWSRGTIPRDIHVPSQHLAPIAERETDPVAVCERLVGTPYLWGGNSSDGLDCSGLVQAGCLACGIACPGDSDMQETALGRTLPPGTPPERGDLLFWKGHVAWVSDPETLLHANAFHMAVAFEPIADALARIESQGDGCVTRHARLSSSL